MGNFRRELTTVELDEINRKVPIAIALHDLGVSLDGEGDELVGFCPFHYDHIQTFWVRPRAARWRCMGKCQKEGGIVELVMHANRCSYRHAIEVLMAGKISTLKARRPQKLVPFRSKMADRVTGLGKSESDYDLLDNVEAYYVERLVGSQKAIAYLKKRRLYSQDLIAHFGLGYSDRTLTYHVTDIQIRDRLKRLGIFRQTGHEHFWGSLVVPIKDEQGRITNIYGRKVRDDLSEGTQYHMYMKGDRSGIFNVAGLVGHQEIILCESVIDALTVFSVGFQNVTCCFGPDAFGDELLTRLVLLNIETVIIAFGRDASGDRGALAVAKALHTHGIASRRVLLPRGMDINRYSCAVDKSQEGLGNYFRASKWIDVTDPEAAIFPGFTAASFSKPATLSLDEANVKRKDDIDGHFRDYPSSVEGPSPTVVSIDPIVPIDSHIAEGFATFTFKARLWRVSWETGQRSKIGMRQKIAVQTETAIFTDIIDILAAKSRQAFVKAATKELGLPPDILRRELGHILLNLEVTLADLISVSHASSEVARKGAGHWASRRRYSSPSSSAKP